MARTSLLPTMLPLSWQKDEWRTVLLVVAVCSAVALMGNLERPQSIRTALLTTNAIGLTQWSVSIGIRLLLRGRLPAWALAIYIPGGYVLGARLAALAGGPDLLPALVNAPLSQKLSFVLLTILITAFFLFYSHSRGVKTAWESERRRAAEAQYAEAAARLALLQAQIEPHFLHNTLANIHSLIGVDPERAAHVLEQLNSYLRTSLRRTRQPVATLGDELELVEKLLDIAAVRLGSRLEYRIVAPAELRSLALPPLLLQPLVENAIRHGIEPAVEGGRIEVTVERAGSALGLTVTDTGVGLREEAPAGVGLENIRNRLASLYGTAGSLALHANVPRGVIARLRLPDTAPACLS